MARCLPRFPQKPPDFAAVARSPVRWSVFCTGVPLVFGDGSIVGAGSDDDL